MTALEDTVPYALAEMQDVLAGGGSPAWHKYARLFGIAFAAINAQPVSVTQFGAVGDGVTDDTAAFIRALAYIATASGSRYFAPVSGELAAYAIAPQLTIPPGSYNLATWAGFDASALSSPVYQLSIVGGGYETTRIVLPTGKYFINSLQVRALELTNIHFTGGAGAIRLYSTNAVVYRQYMVDQCVFSNYTVCAIGSLAADQPNWKITNCIFHSATSASAVGIALSGLLDTCIIEGNSFEENRVHIKAANFGNIYIRNNGFLRWSSDGQIGAADIWFTPQAAPNSGWGTVVSGNKFGNENLKVGDNRVVVANEDTNSGADFATRASWLTTMETTKRFSGVVFRDNLFNGAAGITQPYFLFYTSNVEGCEFDNEIGGTYAPYYAAVGSGGFTSYIATTNVIRVRGAGYATAFPGIAAADAGGFIIDDPIGGAQGQANAPNRWGGGDGGSSYIYDGLLTSSAGSPTVTSTADQWGNSSGAKQVVFSASTDVVFKSLTGVTTGRMAWIEVNILCAASNPLTAIKVQVSDGASVLQFQRIVGVQAAGIWQTVRLPWVPLAPTSGGLAVRVLASGLATGVSTVVLGRVRVYHGNSAEAHGRPRVNSLMLEGGTATPATVAGYCTLFVDAADGALKLVLSDGTVKTVTVT